MNYIKEVTLEDTITIEKSNLEKPMVFTVNANNKTSFALQLNLK
jgi:hypothetical protein